jgi:minor extracellular serine protease Vpr
VLARGGGRIDLVTANDTPLTLDPVSASFGFWNGNKPVSGSVVVSVLNVSGGDQSCSVSVTGPSFVTASPSSFNLASGESTSITLTIDAGTEQETGSGDYDGDAIVDCGESVLQAPWWARISRNGKP